MSMMFYCGSGSPPAWRVWLGLEHKQLPYELKMLSFSAGDLKSEGFTQLNPRQKVPVLVENGFVLYESVAILEYLEERYPVAGRGRLFPDDARERALVRRFIQETDWYLGMGMGRMLREIFHKAEKEWDRSVIADGRGKLAAELAHFEREIRGDFLAGVLSAADLTLYPMIALALRADLKDPALAVRTLVGPKLTAWMGRIEALPYFARTLPPHWKNN